MHKKAIAIFFWEGYLSVAPTIINLADSLAEKGHKVMILMRDISIEYSPDTKLHENVQVVKLSNSKRFYRFSNIINKIPKVRGFFNIMLKDKSVVADLISQSKKILKKNNFLEYDCIGVDPIGLYWASKAKSRNSDLYYLSLELLCRNVIKEEDRFLNWIKNQEINVHKRLVKKTLIQDQYRLNTLFKENDIRLNSNYHILTNSPRNKKQAQVHKRNDYFNRLFSLPADSVVMLMAGWISEMMMAKDLAGAFGKFTNKNVNLVFHEREKRNESEPYLQELKMLGKEQFYLSLNPLPYSQIDLVYGSADIGLVFYSREMGENFELIVGASGKMGHYLMNGMPVIAFDLPGFKELFSKYNMGIVIEDVNQLESAVNTILKNYQYFSKNALLCYEKEYDFDFQFDSFYKSNFLS